MLSCALTIWQVEEQIVVELAHHGLLATAERPVPHCITYEDLGKLTYLNAVIKVRADPYPVPVGLRTQP